MYAELVACATADAAIADLAVGMKHHLILKLCTFVAERARAVPRDEDSRRGQRNYNGKDTCYVRFGAACGQAFERVEAARMRGAPSVP